MEWREISSAPKVQMYEFADGTFRMNPPLVARHSDGRPMLVWWNAPLKAWVPCADHATPKWVAENQPTHWLSEVTP